MIYKRYSEGEELEEWYLDPYRVYFWLTMAVLLALSIVVIAWPELSMMLLHAIAERALQAQLAW